MHLDRLQQSMGIQFDGLEGTILPLPSDQDQSPPLPSQLDDRNITIEGINLKNYIKGSGRACERKRTSHR